MPFAQSKQSIIEAEIGKQNYELLQHIKQLSTQKGIQAKMSYDLKIE